MPSFSHIPKRKTRLTSCMDFGQRIMYSMWWIQHRPHLTTQAAVVHAPELQMQRYVRHAAWMTICFIFHSVIAPTTWSVSCCRPPVLLPAVILYCSTIVLSNTFVHCMITYHQQITWRCIVFLHLIRFFVCSDDLQIQIMADSALGWSGPCLSLVSTIEWTFVRAVVSSWDFVWLHIVFFAVLCFGVIWVWFRSYFALIFRDFVRFFGMMVQFDVIVC